MKMQKKAKILCSTNWSDVLRKRGKVRKEWGKREKTNYKKTPLKYATTLNSFECIIIIGHTN